MGALFSSLFNPATLIARIARAASLAAAAATAAMGAGTSGKAFWSAVGLAFLGGFIGVGEPNKV